MRYELVDHDPVPIWFGEPSGDSPSLTDEPILNYAKTYGASAFRGVGLPRLPQALRAGVDVEPTDSVIYCDDPEKAYEYGGPIPVLLCYRYKSEDGVVLVRRAVAQIGPDTPPEDAQTTRELYPFVVGSPREGFLDLCRVKPESVARLNYLRAYGHFIPGDPLEALIAIFVYGDSEGLAQVRELLQNRDWEPA